MLLHETTMMNLNHVVAHYRGLPNPLPTLLPTHRPNTLPNLRPTRQLILLPSLRPTLLQTLLPTHQPCTAG
jgi:hypothetical protein